MRHCNNIVCYVWLIEYSETTRVVTRWFLMKTMELAEYFLDNIDKNVVAFRHFQVVDDRYYLGKS